MELRKYDEQSLKKLQKIELEMLHDFVDICEKHHLQYFGIGGTAIGALRHQGFIPWDDDIDLAFVRSDYERFCKIVEKDYSNKYYILRYESNKAYPLFTARMCKKGTVFQEHAMKNVDCPFGIFLDLYAYDNVPDDRREMKKQAAAAWVYSKLLILCSIEQPNLVQLFGWKKKAALAACKVAHHMIKLLHISTDGIVYRCKKCCTRYNKQDTKRLAYLTEAKPYGSMIKKKDLFPLIQMPFEDLKLNFPNHMHEMMTAYYGDYMQLPPEEKRYNHCPYQLKFGDEEESSVWEKEK
ncbi:MAG: LicD family protein [Clostridia bacterium]|nr:LicD family protein [Clostridia bacterium]NCC44519.1 LicD family protein [Clostridia bacterium]